MNSIIFFIMGNQMMTCPEIGCTQQFKTYQELTMHLDYGHITTDVDVWSYNPRKKAVESDVKKKC